MATQDPRYVHPAGDGDRTGGTATSPAGWLWDNIRAWFNPSRIDDRMRGEPEPMGPRDAYPGGEPYAQPQPWGNFHLLLTRRFDRGAEAYGYRFGAMTYNPIGAGVVTTRPMVPTIPAGNKLPFGIGVTWEPQGINYGATPDPRGPLYTPQQVAALMGDPALAGRLPSVEFIAPPEGGF